ncbi:MAG: PAS domain S-box protein [Deltaproteobacteria bacterium]|nr:PAS domain S-box protein [Deltaproteobacteria bacterium]MBI4795698.1 PAS domain S-box protein [Deltaproteobacteria bacterium]
MSEKARPIRIAIFSNQEAPACQVVSLPFSLEGYPPVELEIFQGVASLSPAEVRQALKERQPEGFDIILDGEQLALDLAPEPVVSGPRARMLEGLLCQLQEFRQKQEINTGIINSATDAIVTINEDHIIIGYNKGAEKILGYTREEALGQNLKLIIPPPHKDVHQEYVRRYVATRQPHVIGKHVRLTAQRRDRTEFPMSISFSVAEVRGNLYFTGIIRDITETKEMEDRLLQSERLAAVGNTVTHIAHEIKNPLLIIGGFARQLIKATELDDKARQKLAIIAEEVARLEGMVAEMRDFVRPPVSQKTLGHLEPLLTEVLEFFQENFKEHHIQVRLQEDGSLPPVSFDANQIRQVLINLFKNAVEAMPRGGELTVATRVKGPNVEVSVIDTGEGMPPEVAANIFTPYFTTKEKGTGLGLAICNFIVKEQHGGRIEVESTPGKGSTFTIQLPAVEASAD